MNKRNSIQAAGTNRVPGTALRLIAGTVLVASFFLLTPSLSSANCETIPAGKFFWVRLLDEVASYSSKPGEPVRGMLVQSPECNGVPVFPAGIEVLGEIVSVKRVGMGLRRDTAKMEIQFNRIVTFSGETLPIASQVVEIDNARETVKHGVIQGIRATNSPQGRITSHLIHMPTFNPYTDWGLIVYRACFTVLPEPEIYLPAGADLRVELRVPLYVGDQPELTMPSFQLDEIERGEVETLVQDSTGRTSTGSGKDADVVNLLFVGSWPQVEDAFKKAGWLHSDRTSARSVFRQMGAVLTFSNYPTAPISMQYLNGKKQEVTWQKSLDSYAKREHLRLWSQPTTVGGQTAWLTAYTRETGAAFSVKNRNFIHHIDRNLDQGVNMLIRDLSLAGCVSTVRSLPRPEMARNFINATGDEMRTDGTLEIVHLKDCEHGLFQYTHAKPTVAVHPHSKVARYFRTQILVYKSDVIRGNILYSGFSLARLGFRSLFHHYHPNEEIEGEDDNPLFPVTPELTTFQSLLGQSAASSSLLPTDSN